MGPRHPDRNAQLENIARLKKEYLEAGWPVISVDTKKKELLGDFYRDGRIDMQEDEHPHREQQPGLSSRLAPRVGLHDPMASVKEAAIPGWGRDPSVGAAARRVPSLFGPVASHGRFGISSSVILRANDVA
jgi:hypothetical protein